jgi:oxygen-independent coproporphyrinogen-3 oxidase
MPVARTLLPGEPTAAEIDRIAEALGPASRLTYAPPHIYPMSAPVFEKTTSRDRPHPATGPLGIYVHIPFCNYACSFCFYAKRVGDGRDVQERYVAALLKELEWVEPGTPLNQLFVGGGTPTVLPADLLDRVLTGIFTRLTPSKRIHTVEGSPESISDAHLDVLQKHGIERVSMGVQSLRDNVLERIHRRHDAPYALSAIDKLVRRGFIVNIDLIYGLPEQTEENFREDFHIVAEHGAHAVTAYNLRVNEKTPVTRSLIEDERLDLAKLVRWRAFIKHMAHEHGFRQTRWHTFKRPATDDPVGRRAAEFEDVTGMGNQFSIGLSARSRLNTTVYRSIATLNDYLERVENNVSPIEDVFPLHKEARKTRFIALTLGDGKPLDRSAYDTIFGESFDIRFGEPLNRLQEAGLVAGNGVLTLTETGKLVHDLVTLAFYPQHVKEWLRERERAAVESGRLKLKMAR